jgi:hypothetical protein
MKEDTMPRPAPSAMPPLLLEVWRLLAAHRPAVRQARCFARLRILVVGTLLAVARPTSTGLLRTLGLTDAAWSAFYRLFGRDRLDYDSLSCCFVKETLAELPAAEPSVARG